MVGILLTRSLFRAYAHMHTHVCLHVAVIVRVLSAKPSICGPLKVLAHQGYSVAATHSE